MTIQPFETLIAEALAGAIISGGQKGNGPAIIKRAQTALAIASGFQQLAQGNAAPGVAAIQTALTNADLDPGVALAINGVFSIGAQQASLLASINAMIPGLGTVALTISENVATGVISAANAEIAHYTPKST